ncbi:Brp/Blh family beta-carotene 15,15'-dioxygenase, partial [bacterium]|nr:Brp/Blh family beta-carotene 15,15'-dioxygenase [bacterium]
IRHSISLTKEINTNLKKGLPIFIKKALPLTIISIFGYICALYILNNYNEINDSIYKVIFIGLASLTFPHILLEYLIEKNE